MDITTSNGPEGEIHEVNGTKVESPVNEENVTNVENNVLTNSNNDSNNPKIMKKSKSENLDITNKNISSNGLAEIAYEEGQWSPSNPTGKKQYNADFLLSLRNTPVSLKKPENNPQLDLVVADNELKLQRQAVQSKITDSNNANFSGKNFAPSYAKASPRSGTPSRRSQHGKQGGSKTEEGGRDRRDGRQRGGGGGGGGFGGSKTIEINLDLRRDVKLNECENAWKPTHAKKEDHDKTDADKILTEDLYKKFRSILNKLTPQNFQKLISQVRELQIDNEERLTGVIKLVFEKAIDEPNFAETYALMCKELEQIKVKKTQTDNNNAEISFRVLIIKRCQAEFEKASVEEGLSSSKLEEIAGCTDLDKKKSLQLLLEEEERKQRVRSVGNVRFIGELFKQNYIRGAIMITCIQTLLKKLEEETIECLCKLLTTIGKDLEMNHHENLQAYFTEMKKIADDKTNKLSSRIRFMLKDVIELKLNSWIPRQKLATPKRLEDIELESDMERLNKSAYSKYSSSMSTSQRDDRSYSGRNMGSRSVNEDSGWSVASSRTRPKQPYVVDSGKLRNIGATGGVTEAISLQPTSHSMWSRGSASGKKEATPSKTNPAVMNSRKNSSTRTFNQYTVLDDSPMSETVTESVKSLTISDADSKLPPTVPTTSKPEAEKLTFETLKNDFLKCNGDPYSELLDNIQIGFPKEEIPSILKKLINWSLEFSLKEKKSKILVVIGKVLGSLVCKKVITIEEFLEVFKDSLQEGKAVLENKEYDNKWDYLSKLIWSFGRQYELTFSKLHSSCTPIIEMGEGYDLLMALFLEKIEDSNELHVVKKLWEESDKMTLTDWMSDELGQEFVKCMPYDFLSFPKKEETGAKIEELMKEGVPIETIEKWIQINIGAKVEEGWFIRELTNAFFTYTLFSPNYPLPTFQTEKCQRYYQLLVNYIANKRKLELECLYAIQNLMTKLEHPQGIALQIFEYLWENGEAVSNEALLEWESDEVTQPEGKGVMVKMLTSLFTVLKSTDDSSDDNSPNEDDQ